LLGAVYRDHPAALVAAPAAAIEATTAKDLREFHAARYRPNATLLIVAGDVTLEGILPKVREAFGDWQRREAADTRIPAVPAASARRVHLMERPGSVQTMIQLGIAGITRTDPEYFPLLVMNEILGGQSSSRLQQNLREKNGYTYRAYSSFTHVEAIAIKEKNYVKWYHEELKRRTRYASQWCHGAPGMNPLFLANYTRTGDQRSLLWATDSTKYLLDQGVNVRENASVCHGIAGNAASLLMMYEATGNEDYFATIRGAVELLYGTMKEDAQGIWWDSPDNRQDYSYMTGLAGVGDFFVLLQSEGRLKMFGPLGYGDDLAASTAGSADAAGR